MSTQSFEFDAVFTEEVIGAAAKAFVQRYYVLGKYRTWLIAACIINPVGFAFAVMFGVDTWILIMVGFIAMLGPVYFPLAYFRLPGQIARRMKLAIENPVHVSVNSSGFSLATKGRTSAKAWSDLKAIAEFPEYFLLVVSAAAFTLIPKHEAPLAATELIRELARPNKEHLPGNPA